MKKIQFPNCSFSRDSVHKYNFSWFSRMHLKSLKDKIPSNQPTLKRTHRSTHNDQQLTTNTHKPRSYAEKKDGKKAKRVLCFSSKHYHHASTQHTRIHSTNIQCSTTPHYCFCFCRRSEANRSERTHRCITFIKTTLLSLLSSRRRRHSTKSSFAFCTPFLGLWLAGCCWECVCTSRSLVYGKGGKGQVFLILFLAMNLCFVSMQMLIHMIIKSLTLTRSFRWFANAKSRWSSHSSHPPSSWKNAFV